MCLLRGLSLFVRARYTSGDLTGTVYTGDWANDKRHGKGTTEFKFSTVGTEGAFPVDAKTGDRYEGEHEDDAISGAGVWYASALPPRACRRPFVLQNRGHCWICVLGSGVCSRYTPVRCSGRHAHAANKMN